MIKSILKRQRFKVFEAEDISTVKNSVFSNNVSLNDIDLILLDINLRDGSGFELLSFLHERYPSIPVIMMSVEDKKETVIKAIKLGARDYILKPFTKETLLSKVTSLLPSERLKRKYRNDIVLLINDVSLEIDRSVRSKLPFTLLKIKCNNFDNDLFEDCRKILSENVREIDRVYSVGDNEFVLLLPLTNEEGARILLERLKEKIRRVCSNIQEKIVSFPKNVEKSSKLDFHKRKQYKEELFRSLEIPQLFWSDLQNERS